MVVLIAACIATAYARATVWHDDITLWSDVVTKAPTLARGYANLGGSYLKQNQLSSAFDMFNTSLGIELNSVSLNGLGNVFAAKKLWLEALDQYSRAAAHEPRAAEYYYNRGIAEFNLGWYAKAVSDYSRALDLNGKNAKTYMNRGNAYDELGRTDEALRDYASALAFDPNDADVVFNRGLVLRRIGKNEQAHSDFQFACERGIVAACRELLKGTGAVP